MLRPNAPKPSRWTIRKGFLGRTLALTALAVSAALWWMTAMPGSSFAGPIPPPTDDETAIQRSLEADVRKLAVEIGERSVFLPQALEAAAAHVESRLREAGLAPRRESYDSPTGRLSNIVAEVAGGAQAQEIVLVGAHYDSVAGTPGANDNATGVAAMLVLASRFAQAKPARTLRFVAFTGEEPPCFLTEAMGSLVHAKGCRARGERVEAMFALETMGCFRDDPDTQQYPIRGLGLLYPTRGNFIAFAGGTASRSLVRTAVGAFREHARVPSDGAAFPIGVPGVGWSDHWSFAQQGYDAVMVTDTAIFRDRTYHSSRDTIEHLDFRRLSLVVSGLEHVVRRLASGG